MKTPNPSAGSISFGVVVEGHGDVEAVPVILRRISHIVSPGAAVRVLRPIRCPRNKAIHRKGELERALTLAAEKAGPHAPVIVVFDADDDCPAELGPALLERARRRLPDRRVAVVLAKREFEAWFLAALPSLRGRRELYKDAEPPSQPEEVRGAKEWLSNNMTRKYRETVDQPGFAGAMDLEMARAGSPSFDKLWRDVVFLLEQRRGEEADD